MFDSRLGLEPDQENEMTKLTARTLLATTLFIAMLCATNAQAIPLGSWNSDADEDNGRGTSIVSQIFEGSAWSSPGPPAGNGRAFGRVNLGGINLGGIISQARDLIAAHRSGEIIRIDIPDIRPHFGGGLTPVPEPTAALLFAIGVGVVATRRRI